GRAIYAGEHPARDLLYGVVVSAGITRGRITCIDTSQALLIEGVVEVITHENRPHAPWYDMDNGSGTSSKRPFRALCNEIIEFAAQPIALVVGTSFEAARRGAMKVQASYQKMNHNTRLEAALAHRRTPEKKQKNNVIKGDVEAACAQAAAMVQQRYCLAMEHHHPMEMHATTVEWHGNGSVTVYDKNQGSQHAQEQLAKAFGYTAENLKVVNSFVGGAFGSGLGSVYQAYL